MTTMASYILATLYIIGSLAACVAVLVWAVKKINHTNS